MARSAKRSSKAAKPAAGAKPAKKGKPETAIVSAAELAALLGVSAKTIAHLAMSGAVVRTAKGRYDRDGSVLAYCESLRKAAAGRSSPTADEKARLVRLQADAVERKNAEAAGELVRVADVQSEWAGLARYVRAGMLAVPSRISPHLPQLGPTDLAMIDREIRDVLTGISEDQPPGKLPA